MCSGRVDLSFVLRAFSNGMDGVFIGGCHLNECHYITDGNYHALSMVLLCKKIMQYLKLKPERLRIDWVSAGEGIRFAEIMNEFSMELKSFGRLGIGEGMDEAQLRLKLDAAKKIIPYLKLVERERLRVHLRSEEAYHEFYDSEELNKLFNALVADKLAISQITTLLGEGPLSTGEISSRLGLGQFEVSKHMNNSSRQGLVRFDVNRGSYSLTREEARHANGRR